MISWVVLGCFRLVLHRFKGFSVVLLGVFGCFVLLFTRGSND